MQNTKLARSLKRGCDDNITQIAILQDKLVESTIKAYLTEDKIRLIFDRVVLEDDRCLSYYDIIDGTRMHMFYRLRQAIPYFSPETSSDADSD